MAGKRNNKLLVVEDEPEIAEFYTTVLSDSFEISIASSGEDALKQIRNAKDIDLVILDYRLPDMSGMEVLTELKKARPSTPVIIVTAFGDEDVAVKAFRRGARDYIKKPFDSSDLLKKIEFYLSLTSPGGGFRRCVSFDEHHSETGFRHNATTPSNNYKIQKAIKYIDDNYVSNIRLGIVAQKSCMSESHFSRIFRELTGMTYPRYLNSRRVEKAKEMLRNGMTITEVAFSVGYNDLRHFQRIFKNVTGYTHSYYKTLQDSQENPKKAEKAV